MSDRLSAERIDQIRATTRRDVICPGAPVKGGCHQWTAAGPHWQCGACGHIIPRCQHLPDIADLLGEVEQMGSVVEELAELHRSGGTPPGSPSAWVLLHEPLRLHWSPQDVELSDDGGAVLMLTHSGGRPAVLELTADQAAALRDDLADCGRDPDPRGIGDTT
jgi:hypothetical protein